MSKRPGSFKKFQIPKKVAPSEADKKKEEEVAPAKPPPASASKPQPAPKPQQLGSPKKIQGSSSESEDDISGPSRLSKPTTGNLVISNENFHYITKQLNEIHALVRRRAQVIQNHDAIAEALNTNSTPPTFNISQQLPKPPYGVVFSDDFVASHREKVKQCSKRLARNLAAEYQRISESLKKDIDGLVEAAEGSLFMIIDEGEQARAVQLFRIKLQALYRRVNNGNSRRHLKGKRQLSDSK